MTGAPPSRHRTRGLRLLTAVVSVALALGGCDSGGGTDPDDDTSVLGTWILSQTGLTAYLVITSSTVTQYIGQQGGCFSPVVFQIVGQDGDTYTLDTGASTFDVTLTREGDDLRVRDDSGTALYSPSTDDPAALDECVFPDDAGISCEALPEIRPSQAIDGELSQADGTLWEGEFYDLYGLRLDGSADVAIGAASQDFDTVILLFDGGGDYIDENDDYNWPESTDSRLEVSLAAGCFRVVVTSFYTGETGSYELSVE